MQRVRHLDLTLVLQTALYFIPLQRDMTDQIRSTHPFIREQIVLIRNLVGVFLNLVQFLLLHPCA